MVRSILIMVFTYSRRAPERDYSRDMDSKEAKYEKHDS
jgi:hypothetical protein